MKKTNKVFKKVKIIQKISIKKIALLTSAVLAVMFGAVFAIINHVERQADAAISVTSIIPSTGSVAGGEQITITGTDFQQNTTWKLISAGVYNTCAVSRDNKIYCWGDNNSFPASTPTAINQGAIPTGATIRQIVAGWYHACALTSESQVYCWGRNDSGQLGSGTNTGSGRTPVAVSNGAMPSIFVKSIASGGNHTCAIASNDRAYCWGLNDYGIFGNGTTTGTSSNLPTAVSQGAMPSGATVKSISANYYNTCAIASDNKTYCWGRGTFGSNGNGVTTDALTPIAVSQGAMPSTAASQVWVRSTGSCALASNNKVYCWGLNNSGQLGNGTTTQASTPVALSHTATIQQVTGGSYHTCALANGTTVYCWGSGAGGRLGNNSTADKLTPTAIYTAGALSGKTVRQVSAGWQHTCALASDNKAYCWGMNNTHQIGNDTTTDAIIPTAVKEVPATPIVTLGGAACTNVTVISNTQLTCTTPAHEADSVNVSVTINGVSQSSSSEYKYTTQVNTVTPHFGSTAGGTNVTIAGQGFLQNLTWKKVAPGRWHTCAIASDDKAYCWGRNHAGQLGDGTTTNSNKPVAVSMTGLLANKTIKDIGAGQHHTCVIASDDNVYCWGSNPNGQLGNNSTTDSLTPVAVDTSGVLSGKTIKQLALRSSTDYTCVIASDDKAYCWGYNNFGQLGDNSLTSRLVPVAVNVTGVLSGKTVKQIVTSSFHACAIASDDKAYCWGRGESGQLGNGANGASANSYVPVAVSQGATPAGSTIKQLALGNNHTCAIASNGGAYCWGSNHVGQLGNGSTSNSNVPTTIVLGDIPTGLSIPKISVAADFTCVVASDDKAYCWGRNGNGQIGTGSNTQLNILVPTAVKTSGALVDKRIRQISAGADFACVIANDDKMYCWGANTYGQLGIGSGGVTGTETQSSPTAVANVPLVPTVTFGGTACTNVTVVSDTTLTCTTPPHTEGKVDVAIDNGAETVTLAQSYTYHDPMTVTNVSPKYGLETGGTSVTITGNNFLPPNNTPDGYVPIEYVNFDGTKYIDTGINQIGNTKINIDFAVDTTIINPATNTVTGTLFSARSGGSDAFLVMSPGGPTSISNQWGKFRYNYGNQALITSFSADGNRHAIEVDNNIFKYDGVSIFTSTGTAPTKAVNIYLGTLHDDANLALITYSNNFKGDIYGFKIWKSDVLVADYTPMKRLSDGATGFWDNVSQAFKLVNTVGTEPIVNLAPTITFDTGTNAVQGTVTAYDNNSITVTTPAHTPGLVSVTVNNGVDTVTLPATCNDNQSYGGSGGSGGPGGANGNGGTACNGQLDYGETRNSDRTNVISGFLYEETYLDLSVDDNLVMIGGSAGITPNSNGVFGSDSSTVTTYTNNPTGYKLYISTNQPGTNSHAKDLQHQSLDEYITSTANTCTWSTGTNSFVNTTNLLTNNTWGFTLNPTNLAAEQLCQVPDDNNPLTIKRTQTANETGDTTNIFFGAKVDLTLPAGKYQSTIIYTAVADVI